LFHRVSGGRAIRKEEEEEDMVAQVQCGGSAMIAK
jgi:hypothetical protein